MKRPLVIAAALAATTAVLFSGGSDAAATYTLSIGSLAPDGTPWRDMLQQAETRIEKASAGRVNVILRPPGFMGEVEMVEEVRKGERLQGAGVTTAALAQGGNIPQLQLVELPYLFNNNAEADYVLDTLLFKELGSIMARRGFKLAIWSENGWRSFATRDKAIRSPTDLKGLKMRSQESDVHMATYKLYGATAIQKPMTEVLASLNSGAIDGLDNTALFINAGGLSEPLKYFTLSRHIYQPACIIYSKSWFDALPADVQAIVMDVKDLGAPGRRSIRSMEGEMMDLFEDFDVEVIELSAAQRQAFATPARGMHDAFAATIDGGPALLSKMRASLKAKRGK